MSLNPKKIHLSQYAELQALSANPAFRALPFVDPDGMFLMHRDGPSSYAIIPEIDQSVIIKVRKAKANFCVMFYQQEHTLINTIREAKFGQCKAPEALAYGNSPQFLAMKRLGPDFFSSRDLYNYYQEHAEQIAVSLAEFAIYTYNKMDGMVHTDLHPNNSTLEPGGKIGIIDIAALSKTKPERMLGKPILFNSRLAFRLAQIFSNKTGYQFCLDNIERRAQLAIANHKLPDRERAHSKKNFVSFMLAARQDNRTFRSDGVTPA